MKTDVLIMGYDFGGKGGRRRGGVVGLYPHRPNGNYGKEVRPPLFLRLTITDRNPEEVEHIGTHNVWDPEQRKRVRHAWVFRIDDLPHAQRERLRVHGHVEVAWRDVARLFTKNVSEL